MLPAGRLCRLEGAGAEGPGGGAIGEEPFAPSPARSPAQPGAPARQPRGQRGAELSAGARAPAVPAAAGGFAGLSCPRRRPAQSSVLAGESSVLSVRGVLGVLGVLGTAASHQGSADRGESNLDQISQTFCF